MYTWYVSGVAMEISMIELSWGLPYTVPYGDYAMAMDEYFWGQWQGYDLGE